MLAFEATTVINASPESVWAVLTDVQNFPTWEPNVIKVEGQAKLGEKVVVHTKLSERAFPVTVSEFIPNQKMVWSSGMPLGLFKGARTFTLTPVADGTQVKTREEFTGFLLPMFRGQIGDLQPSFDAFARALKERVEANT
ncbi:MAG: SRPBCC domain-containing protein [Chloroflexota bacterium]